MTSRGGSISKMDLHLKENLIRSVDTIKSKIRDMKNAEDNTDIVMRKILKPVSEPITSFITQSNHIKQTMNTPEERTTNNDSETSTYFENTDSCVSDLSGDYTDCKQDNDNSECMQDPPLKRGSLQKDDLINLYNNTIGVNIPFGIRNENKQLFMGTSVVKLSKTDNSSNSDPIIYVTLDDKSFELTPGLSELLLKKKPNLTVVTDKDKVVYKNMLSITNVHKRDFDPNGQLKGDRSIKYREIIRPLFSELTDSSSYSKSPNAMKRGGSLPSLKKYKANTDLVYWDDPNELIDRLKILIASRDAGNSSHDNEILAIIEELKEAGIIKE